jgi:NAD(P)-dependent dehydrogenase (short-subunit alcohol dehydrogenase family)
MQQSLTDKVALVTGAAHRVGRAIALALADEGVHIAVHYHGSEEDAHATVREIKSYGVDAIPIQADQADPQQVNDLFDTIREQFGQIDILVNSANLFTRADFLELTYEEWQRTINVNLTGPFVVSQAAARLMLDRDDPGGVIINVLDNSAFQPWPGHPQHGVAKAGLRMLSQIMARSLAPFIRVNDVVPGPVLKAPGGSTERWQAIGERLPVKRTGTPEDVGRAVVYLAQEDFLTGVVLHVDGGEQLIDSGEAI